MEYDVTRAHVVKKFSLGSKVVEELGLYWSMRDTQLGRVKSIGDAPRN